MKKLFACFIALVFYCFSASAFLVSASDEFSPAYDITYDVNEIGLTTVTANIGLTNKTTQYYASEYTLTIPSFNIAGVSARDSGGKVKTQVTEKDDSTEIHLVFNDTVVGLGKTLNFSLSYQTPQLAQKIGRIWEINIPRINPATSIVTYNVTLRAPQTFGPLAYVWPKPAKSYTWTKDELSQGITAAFGDFQAFKFRLTYRLKNPNLYPVYTEIVLPPDTAYQRINYTQILPEPVNVHVDPDGNWIARYDLSPGQKIDVMAEGVAQIYSQPKFLSQKPPDNIQSYLATRDYWEINDNQIQELARKLNTPRQIYDYVVKTLKYDYQKINSSGPRLGAKQALGKPDSAICIEFTDLFITIARAAGIPAREVDGFAYTTNTKLRPLSLEKDILHAWPEYFDKEKNTWVMVDPTWGNTTGGLDYFEKLDFNHFAFAIRGQDSNRPLPAGSYKIDEKDSKDVEVTPTQEFTPAIPKLEVQFIFPTEILAGLQTTGRVIVKNKGPQALYNSDLVLFSPSVPLTKSSFLLDSLPPYSETSFEINFLKTAFTQNSQGSLTAKIAGQSFQTNFKVKPFYLKFWWGMGGGLVVTGSALAIFLARKARRLPFQKQNGQSDLCG